MSVRVLADTAPLRGIPCGHDVFDVHPGTSSRVVMVGPLPRLGWDSVRVRGNAYRTYHISIRTMKASFQSLAR